MIWRAVLAWVPIAVAATALSIVVYGAVQQDLRTGADDPQVQLTEDAAARLDAGAPADAVLPTPSVEMSASLGSWLMVFDRSGALLATSATLHGRPPGFPESVFGSVPAGGVDLISWQPEAGVRSAVAVRAWKGGYVVAGRSLRRVEERESHVEILVAAGWLATLGASAVACLAVAVAPHLFVPARPGR